MKKILAFIFAAVMALSVVGCSVSFFLGDLENNLKRLRKEK